MSTFLQLERQGLGISAAKVVEAIGCSRATYTRWEAGSSIPSDKLSELAELGFDVLYVVTGQRSMPVAEQHSRQLTREEEVLLDNYRHTSPQAQAAIKATSDALAQRKINKKIG